MRDDQSTARAVVYIARVQLGTAVVDLARRVIAAADPAEEILVGVGYRIARAGFRLADVSDDLIEPNTRLARRVAGLPPLPPVLVPAPRATGEGMSYEPTVGQLGLCGITDDDTLGPDAARYRPEL